MLVGDTCCLVDGPLRGSRRRYLHLISANDLQWLQESTVTNAGMESAAVGICKCVFF